MSIEMGLGQVFSFRASTECGTPTEAKSDSIIL
jgi:hypothetical protein